MGLFSLFIILSVGSAAFLYALAIPCSLLLVKLHAWGLPKAKLAVITLVIATPLLLGMAIKFGALHLEYHREMPTLTIAIAGLVALCLFLRANKKSDDEFKIGAYTLLTTRTAKSKERLQAIICSLSLPLAIAASSSLAVLIIQSAYSAIGGHHA